MAYRRRQPVSQNKIRWLICRFFDPRPGNFHILQTKAPQIGYRMVN